MPVFFAIGAILALALGVALAWLWTALRFFRQGETRLKGFDTYRHDRQFLTIYRREGDNDEIRHVLVECRLLIGKILNWDIDMGQVEKDDAVREIRLPDDIVEIWDEMRGALELRDSYLNRTFGFRKAMRCSKEFQKLKRKFWRRIKALYAELADSDMKVDRTGTKLLVREKKD